MANDPETLFGPTAAELGRLTDNLRALLTVRWQLVQLELFAALADIKRLALVLAVAALLALVSLPVLVVAVAEGLDGVWGIGRIGWLLIAFVTLVAAAVGPAWFGWRRFQAHYAGFEETLEVLHEDQAWVDSLVNRRDRPA